MAVLAVVLVAGAIAFWVLVPDNGVETAGPSMRPTMKGIARVEIDAHAFDSKGPMRGDIVAAQAPFGLDSETCGAPPPRGAPCAEPIAAYSNVHVVKRVIAGPGDRIAFAPDGRAIVNGHLLEEPYVRRCRVPCPLPNEITVPAGHYFLAGDNRPVSSDSRYWGPVPLEAIDGRVLLPTAGAQGSN